MMFRCVCFCMCMQEFTENRGIGCSGPRATDGSEHLVWVLGTEPRSSGRKASTLSCSAFSPDDSCLLQTDFQSILF